MEPNKTLSYDDWAKRQSVEESARDAWWKEHIHDPSVERNAFIAGYMAGFSAGADIVAAHKLEQDKARHLHYIPDRDDERSLRSKVRGYLLMDRFFDTLYHLGLISPTGGIKTYLVLTMISLVPAFIIWVIFNV